MKKTMSPLLKLGLGIFVVQTIVERFVISMPNLLAIPILVVAIVLIIVGGFKTRKETKAEEN